MNIFELMVRELNHLQIRFICQELKITENELFYMKEEQLSDVYDTMCDIEASEISLHIDEELPLRGKLASEIVTLWGNALAEMNGWIEEDEQENDY